MRGLQSIDARNTPVFSSFFELSALNKKKKKNIYKIKNKESKKEPCSLCVCIHVEFALWGKTLCFTTRPPGPRPSTFPLYKKESFDTAVS